MGDIQTLAKKFKRALRNETGAKFGLEAAGVRRSRRARHSPEGRSRGVEGSMGRETSPYISSATIGSTSDAMAAPPMSGRSRPTTPTRSISYRSTRRKSLDDAKAAIHAHVEAERARGPQTAKGAKIVPLLFLYWDEHGKSVISPDQIASSIRVFIGFLLHDPIGPNLTISDVTPQLFERFRRWGWGSTATTSPGRARTTSTRRRACAGSRAAQPRRHPRRARAPRQQRAGYPTRRRCPRCGRSSGRRRAIAC